MKSYKNFVIMISLGSDFEDLTSKDFNLTHPL